ncbi:hypothetical protein KI387_038694, partial [Taxus chinensis]
EIISACTKERKIMFGNVLLTIIFSEIGVPDGPEEFVWEYPDEDPSPTKRFEKYTCDTMMATHKAAPEK